jgi:hypothetical protein
MANSSDDAIVKEFGGARLGDPRRTARLLQLVRDMSRKPDASFPKAMSEAQLEGAYRFFGNVKVRSGDILMPHVRQTLERMSRHSVSLVLHDSSTLTFGSEGYREGLGPCVGYKQHFVLHCSLAVSGDGCRRPLGIIANSVHIAENNSDGTFQDRWGEHVRAVQGLGLHAAQVVHVMDREADDYQLFELITGLGGRFVIRMQHDRKLGDSGNVRDVLMNVQANVERTVLLSRRGGHLGSKQRKIHPARDERLAKLSMGSCSVSIPRPKRLNARCDQINLNVVYVWEPEPPEGQAPIEWVLYTTEPVETPEQLLQVVDWYRARWVIEEYFKALKTGCAVEKRQLGDIHSLTNALALFLPIAWHVLLMRNESRDRPDAPASEILQPDELTILRLKARKPLAQNPTIRQVVHAIAALGGHLKHNGEPGWQTIARGYETLRATLDGWRLCQSVESGKMPQFRDQS